MKAIKFILIFLLGWLSCKKDIVLTYQEGLDRCKETNEKDQSNHPGETFISSRDCIVGSALPSFQAQTLSGLAIDKNFFLGKISIINFWFETCPPCLAEIPNFNRIVDKFGKNDFNFLAIGLDYDKDIKNFLKNHPWKFEHISNGRDVIENVFKIKWGYPTTFIVNTKGIIIFAMGGIDENNEASLIQFIENAK